MAKWSDATEQRKSEEFQKISQQFVGMDLEQMEREYRQRRLAKAELEAKEKPLNADIMVLEILFAERYAEEGLKTVKYENNDRITVSFETNYTIEDKARFINWLRETGREFELTIYAARAASIAKEVLAEAGNLPPGMAASQPVPKITYTPAK